MNSQIQHSIRPATGISLGGAALFAFLAGAGLVGAGTRPAAAQSASWEEGCSVRVVTPGNGDSLRALNCERQKMCQQMASAKGGMMMEKGCFFVMPKASAPAAQAGRVRPTQRQ